MTCSSSCAYGSVRTALHQRALSLSREPKQFHRADDERLIPARPLTVTAPKPAPGPADILIRNARLMSEPDKPVTIAIKDGVFTFLGDDHQAQAHIGEHTEQIDAAGRSVLPGLCDSHVHLLIGAERLRGCNVEDVRSSDEFKDCVGQFVRDNPDKQVFYVYGLHYTDPPLIPAETARHLLDGIESDRPLFVYAHDLHTAWANSRAIDMAGLLKPVPPYPPLLKVLDLTDNLVIGNDGLPSGELREPPVYFLVEGPLNHRFPLSAEEKLDYLEKTCRRLAEFGITRVHNMGLGSPEEDIETLMLLLELEQTGRLAVRVFSSYSVLPDEHMLTDVVQAGSAARALMDARHQGQSYGRIHELLLDQLEHVATKRDDSLSEMTRQKPGLKDHPDRNVLADHSSSVRSLIHQTHVAPHQKRRESRVAAGNADTLPPLGRVALQAIKPFMDGVVEKHSAYRLDVPPAEGIPAFSQDEIERTVTAADRYGLQVAAHCIGDGAVHAMLTAVRAARSGNRSTTEERGHAVRHRIEHIESV